MQGKERKESVGYRTHKVVGIIGDKAQIDAACVALTSAGFSDDMIEVFCGLEGERDLDLRGGPPRTLASEPHVTPRSIGGELKHGSCYEEALLAGRCVIQVYMTDKHDQEQALEILKSHGGHYINAYGFWAMERLER